MASFKGKLYSLLVDANPSVKELYETPIMKDHTYHKHHRLHEWIRLFKLIIIYRILKHKPVLLETKQKEVIMQKSINSLCSTVESTTAHRKGAHWFAKDFFQYDLITIDIFEVLFILPCDLQTLYSIMENRLEIHDFSKIRQQAEKLLQTEKKFVSLKNIYSIVSKYTCYSAEKAEALEFDIMKKLIKVNPYIARVIHILNNMNISIEIVSNTYFSAAQIAELLKICKYEQMKIWIAHEHNCFSVNELYSKIFDTHGWDKDVCHVTNTTNDKVLLEKRYCIDAYKYKSAKSYGQKYRIDAGEPISVKLYNGLVNIKMHSENSTYCQDYEFGYKNGAAYVVAFCNEIHQYALKHNINKIVITTMYSNIYQRAFNYMFENTAVNIELMYIPVLLSEPNRISENLFEYFEHLIGADKNIILVSIKHCMRNLLIENEFFEKYEYWGYSIHPFFCEYVPELHISTTKDIAIEKLVYENTFCTWKLKKEEEGIIDFITDYKKILSINESCIILNENDAITLF